MEHTDEYGQGPHPRSTPILVRVGTEEWVVGGDERAAAAVVPRSEKIVSLSELRRTDVHTPEVSHESERIPASSGNIRTEPETLPTPASSRTKKRRRLRESFQFGLIFGMAMGCLGLVFFHQMPAASVVTTGEAGAWPVTATLSGPVILIPATRVYGIQLGAYPDPVAAAAAQKHLKHEGVDTVQVPTGAQKRVLVADLALSSSDLKDAATALSHKGLKNRVVALTQPAKSVPTLSSLSKAQSQALSAWLSAEVSAMNAWTAALADGEPERDAKTAYASAKKLQPKAQNLADTGAGPVFSGLAVDVDKAVHLASEGHHKRAAIQQLMNAYALLAELKVRTT